MHTTLVDPATLARHLADPSWVVVDCRFDLAAPDAGERLYLEAHVPGARYAHLDRDLSGAKTGTNGRHPLPDVADMASRFGALGIGGSCQVVAYDADSSMFAARLWWMLRYLGHAAVAVLDGGLARWQAEGHAVRGGTESWAKTAFRASPRRDWTLSVGDVERIVDAPPSAVTAAPAALIDARAPERYRGENETLDPAAGHIPGARSHWFGANLRDDKRFKPPDELRRLWAEVLEGQDPASVVAYCGSGVTACHNLLALEIAGLHGARLYPGSWSEWCADPSRPIATTPPSGSAQVRTGA